MKKLGGYVLGFATLILVSMAWFYMKGSTLISGDTDKIAFAEIVSGVRTQKLTRLPGGIFFAFPRIEGGIETICRQGGQVKAGYATPHLHTRLVARVDGTCVKFVED
ncbi:hypothetical protein [Asticcacaulis sp. W401b]|uniref:hypothetical protein n=1 Tax=Asticcacaulis sp. W401b TaxID=3388666 RepID=UPI003970F696